MTTGEYLEIDGRPVLRFVRELAHPPARVWTMLTDPAELGHWFPCRPAFDDLAPGATVRFTFETDGVERTVAWDALGPGRVQVEFNRAAGEGSGEQPW